MLLRLSNTAPIRRADHHSTQAQRPLIASEIDVAAIAKATRLIRKPRRIPNRILHGLDDLLAGVNERDA